MFGNMGAGGGINAGAMPQSPAIPPSGINQPNPMMMGNGNFLSDIFEALFSPDQAAMKMAQNGIKPEDFSAKMGESKLTDIMQQQAQSSGKPPVSSLFGDQSLLDRGGYELPKLGASQHGAEAGNSVASLMNPTSPPSANTGNAPQRTNDLMTPGGRIIQPGPDHPDITAATPDNFITMSDILAQIFGGGGTGNASPAGGGGLSGRPGPYGFGADGNPGLNAVPPMFGQGIGPETGPMPVVPPVTPPPPGGLGTEQPMPINPPVVPPSNPNMPNIADYTSGKIKTGVMGSAGGNAPDTQLSGNKLFTEFMDTLKAGGLTNANGLAAAAATAKSESGFNPKNVFGSWNDPSQSGVKGTSGGAMSWRAERYNAMKEFVAKQPGGDTAANQAKFFLQEDPGLIAKLNAAKSPEEAQQLMNNAWKFAGYDKPGGEAGRRIALARNFAASGSFGDGGPISGAPMAAAGAGATPPTGTGQSVTQRLASAASGLTDPGSEQPDLNLTRAPAPIGPRPGEYSPNPDMMKLMLMMLMPGLGGGNNVQSLTQLMQGVGRG